MSEPPHSIPGRPAGVVVALAILVAACSSGDGDEASDRAAIDPVSTTASPDPASPDPDDAVVTTTAPTQTEAVPAPLRWTAPDVAGGPDVVGADLAGKDVVLWFWAPW